MPRPTPAINAITVRGRRKVVNTLRVISGTCSPISMPRISATVILYLPTQTDITATVITAAVITANSIDVSLFFAFLFTYYCMKRYAIFSMG